MTTQHEVLGFTTADLIEAMAAAGIHCSLDKFKRLAIEIQRRAIAEHAKRSLALDVMAANERELGLDYMEAAK